MTKIVIKTTPIYKLEECIDRSIEMGRLQYRPGCRPYNYEYYLNQAVKEWENMGKPKLTKEILMDIRQKTGLGLMDIKKELLRHI